MPNIKLNLIASSPLIVSCGILLLSACVVAPPAAHTGSTGTGTNVQYVPPTIPAHPIWAGRFGTSVAVSGVYDGWSTCDESGQHSKGDWVLRFTPSRVVALSDRTDKAITPMGSNNLPLPACVYVNGGMPLGIIAPPSKLSNGMPVAIKGIVHVNVNGKPYLKWIP